MNALPSNRTWFRIHSFTGVVTGLMLFVICFSGTFAVVSHELDWLANPALRVAPQAQQASWGELAEAVEREYPDGQVLWISAPLYSVSTAMALVDFEGRGMLKIHVDPYTAEITGQSSFVDFQRFIRNFHMNLFGLGGFGIYLVSAFSITLLISLVAALFFYRRWWTRFFRFRTGRPRVVLSESHKTAGLWSLWFVALMALTGIWYLVEMTRLDFVDGKFSHAGTGPSAVHAVPEPETSAGPDGLPLDALIERIAEARPDLDIKMVGPAVSHPGALYVEGDAGHVLVRSRANFVHVDKADGRILYSQDAAELPLYWRWSETADPLHFGDFGGLWSKAIWFLFGLVLCGLIFTGTWLHASRLAASSGGQARHRWPGTWAAMAVTLLVLVASVRAGFGQAREAYGTTIDGVRELPSLTAGVQALIVGWVVLTLLLVAVWIVLLWRPRRNRAVPDAPPDLPALENRFDRRSRAGHTARGVR